jgi:malate synthase
MKCPIEVTGKLSGEFEEILTPKAMQFVADLQREFKTRRKELLEKRIKKQASIDDGEMPNFLSHTDPIREAGWKVNPVPADLQQRRVEITGPTERKMVINALNSGADCFMADFEDSNAPVWSNLIEGQINLRDAINGTIEFTNPKGKHYSLNEQTATLLVRARGWHLHEKNFLVDEEPISGGIFDFGLYFFHNARNLIEKGSGPYFYLPKLQNHEEAWLWNDIFEMAQDKLDIPRGTIKATVLIEHILAAFETEEILYALKNHSAGLNCGRWDYIFSFIKTFKNHKDFVLPDRSEITMDVPCMKAYCQEVVRACHKRGAHAMGGMAAQIPIKNDSEANEAAMNKVHLDKVREFNLGHDGTWVAHPGLVSTAKEAFEQMDGPNQINKPLENIKVSAKDLIEVPKGTITEEGLRSNVNIGLRYLDSWLNGNGCVPLNNLMEDLATSEISRTQIWQWIKHQSCTDKKMLIDKNLVNSMIDEELEKFENINSKTSSLFKEITFHDELVGFIADLGYQYL